MRFIFVIFTMVGLVACGGISRKSGDDSMPSTPNLQLEKDGMPRLLKDAITAFDANRFVAAKAKLTSVLKKHPTGVWSHMARLYLARLNMEKNPSSAATQLEALVQELDKGPLRKNAEFYAGLAAVRAKRCMTAQKFLKPMSQDGESTQKVLALLALSECTKGVETLRLLALVPTDSSEYPVVERRAVQGAEEAEMTALIGLLEEMTPPKLREIVSARLLATHSKTLSRAQLRLIRNVLENTSPLVARVDELLTAPNVGIILPLSGRSALVGQRIKNTLSHLTEAAKEDSLENAIQRVIVDGGTEEILRKNLESLAQDGRSIGAVGVFDRSQAKAAVALSKRLSFPLIMLTLSDAPLCRDCPTWRALHTPLLVARTSVGIGMSRQEKRALIARPANGYGKNHGYWLRRVIEAAGGRVVDEIIWNPAKPDWAKVTRAIVTQQFDTLYLPTNHLDAAQLLRHLAAAGIWAKGAKPRFAEAENMREVTIVGSPEWYRPEFQRLAGRYGHYTIIPVPYAAETKRGASLARRIKAHAESEPSVMVAIIEDALLAFSQANRYAVEHKKTITDALRMITLQGGSTAGLDFRRQDALSALIVLESTSTGFRPLGQND